MSPLSSVPQNRHSVGEKSVARATTTSSQRNKPVFAKNFSSRKTHFVVFRFYSNEVYRNFAGSFQLGSKKTAALTLVESVPTLSEAFFI